MGHLNQDNGKLERRIARSGGRHGTRHFPGSRHTSTTSSFVPPTSQNLVRKNAAAMAGIALVGAATSEGEEAAVVAEEIEESPARERAAHPRDDRGVAWRG